MTYLKTRIVWRAVWTTTAGVVVILGLLTLRGYPPAPRPRVYHAGTVTVRRDTTPVPDQTAGLDAWEQTRASLLLLRNTHAVLPLGSLSNRRFRLVVLGDALPVFSRTLDSYTPVPVCHVHTLAHLPPADFRMDHPVILALNLWSGDTSLLRPWVEALAAHTAVVIVNFGDYASLAPLLTQPTLMQAPGPDSLSQTLAAQALFGGIAVTRRALPQSLAVWPGLELPATTSKTRLGFAPPAFAQLNADTLRRIDRIVSEAIAARAMPGCQVLVAHRGQVVYHRAFGHHTYEQQRPVALTDLYDLASITKVAATTLALMKLYDQGRLDILAQMGAYFRDQTYLPGRPDVPDTLYRHQWMVLPPAARHLMVAIRDTVALAPFSRYTQPRRAPVYNLRIQQLLTHTSGLPAGLPPGSFPGIRGPWFRQTPQPGFSLAVADSLYAFDRMGAILWNTILSATPTGRGYRYSDLNMMLLRRLADTLAGQPMDVFLEEQLYRPLGLQTLGFTPRELRNTTRLVPTAGDVWREQLLQGVVHDPAAALLGGVSGHAGLFSNALDLGILGQMLLNGGTYGGVRFFRPETVALFTRQHTGHRGLGFDLPAGRRDYPVAYTAPMTTYGHTGFTGTCLWVDPEHELVFVFLSNRVHPDPDNNRLNLLEIRQRVHQAVYDALGTPLVDDDRYAARP